MRDEFTNSIDDLSRELRIAAKLMILRARTERHRRSFISVGGSYEAYAYPSPDGINWGINAAPNWECIARGTVK